MELDFAESVQGKVDAIQHHTALQAPLGHVHATPTALTSDKYALLGADLATLASHPDQWATLTAQLDPECPTLLLCECVLAYLEQDAADALLARLMEYAPQVSVLCYDMCISGDAPPGSAPTRFGQVMLQNLSTRHLSLPGARACTTPAAYATRFEALARKTAPTERTVAHDAYTLCASWHALPPAERERVARLEHLDEVEELEMLLGHYGIAWVERTPMVQ